MKHLSRFLTLFFGVLVLVFSGGYLELMIGILDVGIDLPIVLPGTIEYSNALGYLIGEDISLLLCMILSFSLFFYFLSLTHKLNKKKKDTTNYEQIYEGPFIVYLRSFIADKRTKNGVSRISDIRSEEEVLVDILSDIAPVYAIGDPSDKKMPLGASRVYVEDDKWKQVAQELVEKAELVVLRLGETDNFWWEVGMVLKQKPIEKILFVVPQNKNFDNVDNLNKILLEHNIDISKLNISIEKQKIGSISNFVYFDADSTPHNVGVSMPRFFKAFISYENILRSSLSDFLQRYGIKTLQKTKYKFRRIFVALAFLGLLSYTPSLILTDYTNLTYQYPYELVEECIKDSSFVNKYSNNINPKTLCQCINESQKGFYMLNDEDIECMILIENRVFNLMSEDEHDHMGDRIYYHLLMIKKYAPEKYEDYILVLSKAVLLSINYPEYCEEMKLFYQTQTNNLPQWVWDLQQLMCGKEIDLELNKLYCSTICDHIKDGHIGDIIKILRSQIE